MILQVLITELRWTAQKSLRYMLSKWWLSDNTEKYYHDSESKLPYIEQQKWRKLLNLWFDI